MGDTSGWKMQGATETTSMFYPGSAVSSAYGYGGGGGGGGGGNYGNIGMTAHPNNNGYNNTNQYSANPSSTYNDQVYHIQVPGMASRYGYAQ